MLGQDEAGLRNEYNFGAMESAVAPGRQAAAPRVDSDPVSPQDIHVATMQDYEDYSPQEGTYNIDIPTGSGAFGAREDGYTIPPGGGGGGYAAAGGGRGGGGGEPKGQKKHVIKEVLGMNKKSKKGKTDAEQDQIDLQQRWENALQEEERLAVLEQQVAAGETQTSMLSVKAPNLPRKFFCIRPLVYHSIRDEVVPERQRYVTIAFWTWVYVCCVLVINCGVAVGVGFSPFINEAHKKVYPFNKALNTVLACVYLVGIPLSFISWYWRIYKGATDCGPSQHLVALFALLIAVAQSVFSIVGPLNYGVCGIMLAVHVGMARKTGVVAAVVVVLFLFVGEAALMCYFFVKEWMFYRSDMHTRRAARRAAKIGVPA